MQIPSVKLQRRLKIGCESLDAWKVLFHYMQSFFAGEWRFCLQKQIIHIITLHLSLGVIPIQTGPENSFSLLFIMKGIHT